MTRQEVGLEDGPSGEDEFEVASASSVLLATKLQSPAVRRLLVARPALLERLDLEAPRKLILVDAPAGWGKTTLLQEWRTTRSAHHPVAWVSLDKADNDPVHFWSYVIAALRTVMPGIGARALALLESPGTRVEQVVLPPIVNELAAVPRPVSLVLDDYHVITASRIHEAMTFLLEHLPPTTQIVVATRSDPPLPLPSLRARGQLSEIRAGDLRFDTRETAALLNDVFGLALGDDLVWRLQQRTEGWAAGLCLAALSLRTQSDAVRFVEEFAGDDRHIVDYLGTETLAGQASEVREFLLRTSILDRLSASLCDFVTGTPGSDEMLRRIERANLFLVPLDSQRRWFRYHHLFRELLRHELERTRPELVTELHSRAAAWHKDSGSVSAAVSHGTAAGDQAEVAELVVEHWAAYLQWGRLDTVASWLDGLAPGFVDNDPRLCLVRAWIAINAGRLDEVTHWIDTAERASQRESRAGTSSVEAGAAMLRCIGQYMEGDLGHAIQAARRSAALEHGEPSPWHSVGCPVLGIALFWSGATEESVEELEEAMRQATPAGNHLAVIHSLGCLAANHAERGEFRDADQLSRTALELMAQHSLEEHWAATMTHVARGRLLEEEGHLDDAELQLRRAVEISQRGVAHIEIAYAVIALARLRDARGDTEGARALLRKAREAAEECADPGILPDLLARTERRLRAEPSGHAPHPGDRLSNREHAVLRLLPSDMTQREIAATLYMSLNTVKTHTRGIYRKLDVTKRAEAVARARELNVI